MHPTFRVSETTLPQPAPSVVGPARFRSSSSPPIFTESVRRAFFQYKHLSFLSFSLSSSLSLSYTHSNHRSLVHDSCHQIRPINWVRPSETPTLLYNACPIRLQHVLHLVRHPLWQRGQQRRRLNMLPRFVPCRPVVVPLHPNPSTQAAHCLLHCVCINQDGERPNMCVFAAAAVVLF